MRVKSPTRVIALDSSALHTKNMSSDCVESTTRKSSSQQQCKLWETEPPETEHLTSYLVIRFFLSFAAALPIMYEVPLPTDAESLPRVNSERGDIGQGTRKL